MTFVWMQRNVEYTILQKKNSPGNLMLVFHAGDCLFKVAKEGVDLAQLTIGRALGCRSVELM